MPGYVYFDLQRRGRGLLLEGRDLQGCALALVRA